MPSVFSITQAQLKAFQPAAEVAFVDRALAHLLDWLPDRMVFLGGEEALRRFVRDGIRVAWNHGLREERCVVRYLGLMALLGKDFDLDLRWAHVAAPLAWPAGDRMEAAYAALDRNPAGTTPALPASWPA